MKVAVADVGTSSSHLLIAQSYPGGYHVLDTLKIRTKLGECLDSAGNLTPEGEERLTVALTRFHELSAAAGAAEVRVYATSALREAPNGPEVAERMLERTGVYPAIISGEREGELTYLGVAHSLELGQDNVLLDLGGGSLEFVRGNASAPHKTVSLPLGSIRMTRAFVPDGVGRDPQLRELRAAVQEMLGPFVREFSSESGTQFVLSSGTAEAAAEAIAALRGEGSGGVNGVSFSVTELGDLLRRVVGTKPAARSRFAGLEKRLDTIVAGLTVLHEALLMLGAQAVTVSEGALREGMLIEELSQYQNFTDQLSARQRSVLETAERLRVNLVHAQQVAQLCRQTFDALLTQGQSFAPEARSILTAAAALHEAGLIVSQTGHHKHSAYLIRNVGLRGFSPAEIELIAQVARYHRKSVPKPSHSEFMALGGEQQRLVTRLAAILRVSDGLDRSHSGGTRLLGLRPEGKGWAMTLSGASPLDLAGLRLKSDLWEREFGPLLVKVQEEV